MNKFITIGLVGAVFLAGPLSAMAFTSSDTSVINILVQEIQLIEQQISSIQDQIHALSSSTLAPAVTPTTTVSVAAPASSSTPVGSQPGSAYMPVPYSMPTDQAAQPSTVTIDLSVTPVTVAQGGAVSIVWKASPSNVQCYRSWLPAVGYQGTFAGNEGVGNLQPPSATFSVDCKNTVNGATGSVSRTVSVTPSQTSNALDGISQIIDQIRQEINDLH